MKTVPGIVPAFSNMLIFRRGSGPGRSQTGDVLKIEQIPGEIEKIRTK
jgi:hypothetical protein